MKNVSLFLCALVLPIIQGCGGDLKMEDISPPAVIPLPAVVEVLEGGFLLGEKTVITADRKFSGEAEYLRARLSAATGFRLETSALDQSAKAPRGSVALRYRDDPELGDEGYRLSVEPSGVEITASTAAGAFYGAQTLLHLLPVESSSPAPATGVTWSAPAVRISDRPRFGWRAYLLDDARWFHGVDAVKRLLDQMALMKMNVLKWYLTDDQGWRIEIEKYPRLTEVGAWRKDTQVGGWGSEQRSGEPHGGFYTRDEIREVVRYAAERHITIVPVVSMPGHATAAIASYPEMGTARRDVEVETTFGKMPDTFNVADENVYAFLQDILTEVMELFPSKVIHLGGDEVLFEQWMASSEIKALMEREKLSGPAQVQLYFTNRMSQFLESRGRRMMGWNEILGDDIHGLLKAVGGTELRDRPDGRSLATGTIVHFWKGDLELAERAVRQGHDIVNSLHSSTYLDYSYENIPLGKAYAFEPIPPGLDSQYHEKILGLGCQMWSEWTPTAERVEYQTFPRIAAYAEVGWTDAERKDYADFCRRLDRLEKRWALQGIQYAVVPR